MYMVLLLLPFMWFTTDHVTRSGALRARLVRLVQPATVEMVQGIVKTLKDSFGFVERADMEKDVRE